MNIGERIDSAGDWIRARTNRYQKVSRETADPPGVTIPLSLVRSAQFASWMAYFALVYFLWLYTLDIARDRAGSMHLTHVGTWIGNIEIFWPYIAGFAVVAIGIPYVAKIAIPVFMSLRWRPDGWAKAWALFIALAVSLVVIAGTFTVQGDTLLERDRESAVAVAEVEQSNAVLQAQITAKEAELRSMMENRNAYLAQAASVGAAEWERSYIARTPQSDPQRDRIVRALGAARAADSLRGDIAGLRVRLATATTSEAVASRVTTARTSWIADTLSWLEGARAMLLSLVMDIVCLIMPWIALRLEQARARQMAETPNPNALQLEYQSSEEVVQPATQRAQDVAEAMVVGGADPRFAADMARSAASWQPTREVMRDAETGEELVRRRATWAKKPKKKGKAEEIDFGGADLPDETGVAFDGGARTGLSAEQIAAQMQPGNVLARAVDRPVLDGAFEQQQANTDSAQDHDVRDHVGLHDDGGRKAEEQAASEDNADGHNGIARDALQTIHTPNSTPASLEQEAPIGAFTEAETDADWSKFLDEEPLGLGKDGSDGVAVPERELEGAK